MNHLASATALAHHTRRLAPQSRLDLGVIRANQRCNLRQVVIAQSSLCHVRQGVKELITPQGALLSGPQHLLLLAPGARCDVVNTPVGGGYIADLISLPLALIQRFRQQHAALLAAKPPTGPVPLLANAALDEPTGRAWQHLLERLRAGDAPELQWHAAEGVLLALALMGRVAPLLVDRTDPVAERVEQHLIMMPPDCWTAERAAAALNVSVATLRRKLTQEGTGFRQILEELRLSKALAQLQTSQRAIADIAADSGYACASRFTARFRQHYGVTPRELRREA